MKQTVIATLVALGALVPAASAEPAFGFGISYVFGGGSGDVAVGARVFSDDTPQQGAASIGLDYKFGAQSFRPNIGAAWLDNDVYGDLSIGYDLGAQGIDFGIGLGGWSRF